MSVLHAFNMFNMLYVCLYVNIADKSLEYEQY